MAFAGPSALTRRRPALALPFCLVPFLSPFSARPCFARFCAFVVGWNPHFPVETGILRLRKIPFSLAENFCCFRCAAPRRA